MDNWETQSLALVSYTSPKNATESIRVPVIKPEIGLLPIVDAAMMLRGWDLGTVSDMDQMLGEEDLQLYERISSSRSRKSATYTGPLPDLSQMGSISSSSSSPTHIPSFSTVIITPSTATTLRIFPTISSELLPHPFNHPKTTTQIRPDPSNNYVPRSAFILTRHPSGLLTFPAFPPQHTLAPCPNFTMPRPTGGEALSTLEDMEELGTVFDHEGCGLTVCKNGNTSLWWLMEMKAGTGATAERFLVQSDLRPINDTTPTVNTLDRITQAVLLNTVLYAIAIHRDANPSGSNPPDNSLVDTQNVFLGDGKGLLQLRIRAIRGVSVLCCYDDDQPSAMYPHLDWAFSMEYTIVP